MENNQGERKITLDTGKIISILAHINYGASAMNNPVAKNAHKFNKAATHRDRKNDYTRKEKHAKKGWE